MTVTDDGSPAARVGAVYFPLASIEPDEAVQFTAVFEVLATLAVKFWVCEGQPVLFGYKLAVAGVTVTEMGGWLPPHAINNPKRTSDTHSPATVECFETFFPANPTSTTPTIGNVKGSQGERLSARCRNAGAGPVFGPFVVMVTDTGVAPAPAAIEVGLKTQAIVVSVGAKVQPNVTAAAKVVAGATGAAVKW